MTDGSTFYDRALDAADRDAVDAARGVHGIDDEVALLRVQVRRLLEAGNPDPKVLQSGIRLLIQALAAQHRLSGAQAEGVESAAAAAIEQFAALMHPLDTTGDAA